MAKLVTGCRYAGRRVARWWVEAGQAVPAVTRSAERAGQSRRSGGLVPIFSITSFGKPRPSHAGLAPRRFPDRPGRIFSEGGQQRLASLDPFVGQLFHGNELCLGFVRQGHLIGLWIAERSRPVGRGVLRDLRDDCPVLPEIAAENLPVRKGGTVS